MVSEAIRCHDIFSSSIPLSTPIYLAGGNEEMLSVRYEALGDDETRRFEDVITLQDIPIVESQRPELLPLDLTFGTS
jgi:hypothetical protein